MSDSLDDAVTQLVRAVRVEGRSPEHHARVMAQVGLLWPTLMMAVAGVVNAWEQEQRET
jgi:hypothetical protein